MKIWSVIQDRWNTFWFGHGKPITKRPYSKTHSSLYGCWFCGRHQRYGSQPIFVDYIREFDGWVKATYSCDCFESYRVSWTESWRIERGRIGYSVMDSYISDIRIYDFTSPIFTGYERANDRKLFWLYHQDWHQPELDVQIELVPRDVLGFSRLLLRMRIMS